MVDETLTYYESGIHSLNRDLVENSDLELREIVLLAREWVRFSISAHTCLSWTIVFFFFQAEAHQDRSVYTGVECRSCCRD